MLFLIDGCCFVVVHPHLENLSLHSHLIAELLHSLIILLLHLPPHPLRKFLHPFLLTLAEFRPVPLLRRFCCRCCCCSPGIIIIIIIVVMKHVEVLTGRLRSSSAVKRHHHSRRNRTVTVSTSVVMLLLLLPRGWKMMMACGCDSMIGCSVPVGNTIGVICMIIVTGLNLRRSIVFLALDLSPVEIAVAITSSASQCFRGVLLSARHEFSTPVHHVASCAGRMIF